MSAPKGFDPVRLKDLYHARSQAAAEIRAEALQAAAVKIEQMHDEFARYVVESRKRGASWAAMARALGKSDTVVIKAAKKIADREELLTGYLGSSVDIPPYEVLRENRNLDLGRVSIDVEIPDSPDGVTSVMVRGYRDGFELSAVRKGTHTIYMVGSEMFGDRPELAYWAEQLATEGTRLHKTVHGYDWGDLEGMER